MFLNYRVGLAAFGQRDSPASSAFIGAGGSGSISVPRISQQRWKAAAHQGFYEQRSSNVGGVPVLCSCCLCNPRKCMLKQRCLVSDISRCGAQDAQGKPGPATASGDAYGEKENGGSGNAAAPPRALSGKAPEDGASALLGADISARPCTGVATDVPFWQGWQSWQRFHACT